jgi:hypothetical protein
MVSPAHRGPLATFAPALPIVTRSPRTRERRPRRTSTRGTRWRPSNLRASLCSGRGPPDGAKDRDLPAIEQIRDPWESGPHPLCRHRLHNHEAIAGSRRRRLRAACHLGSGHLPVLMVARFQVAHRLISARTRSSKMDQQRRCVSSMIAEHLHLIPSTPSSSTDCSTASAPIPPGMRHSRNRSRCSRPSGPVTTFGGAVWASLGQPVAAKSVHRGTGHRTALVLRDTVPGVDPHRYSCLLQAKGTMPPEPRPRRLAKAVDGSVPSPLRAC